MRRLVLHIGPHKTGTSAFQQWLLDNQSALMAQGVAFPAELTDNGGNAVRLGNALLGNPDALRPVQKRYLQDFSDFCAAHPTHDVVVSSELLSRILIVRRNAPGSTRGTTIFENPFTDNDDPALAHLDPVARRKRKGHWLARNLAPFGFDRIDVLFVIRDEATRLASSWLQVLKKLNSHSNFDHVSTSMLPCIHVRDSLTHFEQLGFAPRAMPYHDPDGARSLPLRLMALAGWEADDMAGLSGGIRLVNTSPGYLKAIGLGHLMDLLGHQLDTRAATDVLRTANGLADLVDHSSPKADKRVTLFAPGAARSINARQIAGLENVEQWCGGLTARNIADTFPAHPEQSKLSWAQLDTDEKTSLDAWLDQIAGDVEKHPALSEHLDPEALRDITRAPRGILATDATYAPCLGGVWVSKDKTGAPPPFTRYPIPMHRPQPNTFQPE